MSAAANTCVASVFSPQPEVARAFVATLCGDNARNGKVDLGGVADVMLEIPPEEPVEATVENLKQADFIVLLLRFVDEETLDIARAVLRLLPPSVQSQIHFAIARQADENEFKMSCPKCEQKLLIKDSLAFRRTQCPRCKHPFTIPGQTDLIRQEFLIPPTHKISKAQLGDAASCRAVVANAYRQAGGRKNQEMSATMRIDELLIEDEGNGSNV